jgi:hypothetical protein
LLIASDSVSIAIFVPVIKRAQATVFICFPITVVVNAVFADFLGALVYLRVRVIAIAIFERYEWLVSAAKATKIGCPKRILVFVFVEVLAAQCPFFVRFAIAVIVYVVALFRGGCRGRASEPPIFCALCLAFASSILVFNIAHGFVCA